MRWLMASPRPVPFFLVVKNGSNSRPRFSRAMPTPVSWMWMCNLACSRFAFRDFRGDRQHAVRAHRLQRVEQQVHERLLQLRVVAAHRVRLGLVMALQGNRFSADLVLQQPQRMVEQLMHVHGRESRALGRGKPQHLRHNGVDALQFAPDDLGQFRVLAFLQPANRRTS